MSRRYIHVNHYDDYYEVLVDSSRILRITKLYSDSGMIRPIEFETLPDSLKDQIIREMDNTEYEI